jgi:hypothetical protein
MAHAVEENGHVAISGYREYTVLEKGIKRKKRVPDSRFTETMGTRALDTNVQKRISQKGVVVSFKKGSLVNLEDFVSKYGLKLKKRLATGLYIFENVSQQDDVVIIEHIIRKEKGVVQTVKPNWKKSNRPR